MLGLLGLREAEGVGMGLQLRVEGVDVKVGGPELGLRSEGCKVEFIYLWGMLAHESMALKNGAGHRR